MKYLNVNGCIIALLVLCSTAHAQISPKTSLFSQLNSKTTCTMAMLDNLFDAKPNSSITLYISEQLIIQGEVIEKVKRSAELESINIRCTNFKNALLNLSRVKDKGVIRYVGTIVSPQHNDILTLNFENGQYFFKKEQTALVMVD